MIYIVKSCLQLSLKYSGYGYAMVEKLKIFLARKFPPLKRVSCKLKKNEIKKKYWLLISINVLLSTVKTCFKQLSP